MDNPLETVQVRTPQFPTINNANVMIAQLVLEQISLNKSVT